MRIIYKTCFLLLSVMAARAAFGQVAAVPDAEELRRPFGADDISNFRTPPRINYPQTWFHFIGGNVSAEGITEDLEAIAGAGISGVQLFHGQFGGPWPGVEPQITALSPMWDDVVKHAAKEAHRLGLRFTMQQAAAMMHISKKTIYAVYPSKEALLLDMVDDAFTRIHARKQRILDGPGTLAEKLRAVIIALPEEYTALDLQQMDLLDEKYPRVAARVREHLETGWEPTLALLEQAMGEGVIRRVSLPVLQRMISASIEDFLADRTLDAQGISYTDALDEMISILLEGLLVR